MKQECSNCWFVICSERAGLNCMKWDWNKCWDFILVK
jgi:hypothetical protein